MENGLAKRLRPLEDAVREILKGLVAMGGAEKPKEKVRPKLDVVNARVWPKEEKTGMEKSVAKPMVESPSAFLV